MNTTPESEKYKAGYTWVDTTTNPYWLRSPTGINTNNTLIPSDIPGISPKEYINHISKGYRNYNFDVGVPALVAKKSEFQPVYSGQARYGTSATFNMDCLKFIKTTKKLGFDIDDSFLVDDDTANSIAQIMTSYCHPMEIKKIPIDIVGFTSEDRDWVIFLNNDYNYNYHYY